MDKPRKNTKTQNIKTIEYSIELFHNNNIYTSVDISFASPSQEAQSSRNKFV